MMSAMSASDLEDGIAAMGGDQRTGPRLHDAGDAVTPAAGAAVVAGNRPQMGIEAGEEAVAAGRRPWLMDAHRADGAALQRLEEALPRRQGGGDPLGARHLAHHGGAIAVLGKHEFDQSIA